MIPQRDTRVKDSALHLAGHKVIEVANLDGVSRTTVYMIKKRVNDGEGVNRLAGSSRKTVVDRGSLRDDIRSSSRIFKHQHARRLGVAAVTVRRAVAKLGALGSKLREENKSARTVSKTKHPASAMSLCLVASNAAVITLIWFPSGYRLTARNYDAKLADKLVLWINNTSDMSSLTVVLQQDDAPARISNRVQHFLREQNFSFWSKNMWPLFSPDANSLDYAFWLHIEIRACNGCHPSTGNGWPWAGTTLSKATRLSDAVLRVSSLRMAVILNKMKH